MSSSEMFPVDRQIVSSLEILNRDCRLDPGRYSESGEKIIRHLKQYGISTVKLEDFPGFEEVFLPDRFTRDYLEGGNNGIPMLGPSTMVMLRLPRDYKIKLNETLETTPLRVRDGDILISRSGTVGRTVLCGTSFSNFVASDDCFRVRFSKDMCGFITTYFESPIGKLLLTRGGHGKVIRHLTEDDIRNAQIPLINEKYIREINELSIKSVTHLENSREFLDDAEDEFYNKINYKKFGTDRKFWLFHNYSFLKNSHALFNSRLDPHFNNPDIKNYEKTIRATSYKPLGNIAEVWMPSRFSRLPIKREFGVPFYSSAAIMRSRRKTGTFIPKSSHNLIKACTVESNTILICRSGAFGGIMGKTGFTSQKMNNFVISEHLIRCVIKDPEFIPEYVYCYLNSLNIGYPIITSYRYGKDVPEIDPNEIKNIPVPYLDRDDQISIASKVASAFSELDNSNTCSDDAEQLLLKELNL